MRFWQLTWRSGRRPAVVDALEACGESRPEEQVLVRTVLRYRFVDEEHGDRDAQTGESSPAAGLLMCGSLHFVDEEHEE